MKFKRRISLLLAFFLLVSNSGMAFTVHYCGDEIASVSSVFSKEEICKTSVEPAKNKCCAEKAKSYNSCCKDKFVNLHDKADDYSNIKIFSFNLSSPFLIKEWKAVVFSSIPNFKSNQVRSYYCDANAPPFFKLYHQYIFYA